MSLICREDSGDEEIYKLQSCMGISKTQPHALNKVIKEAMGLNFKTETKRLILSSLVCL